VKVRIDKNNATGGEISPLLAARSDIPKFAAGASRIENMVVLPEGAITRRPGTRYVMPLRNELQKCRFIPFEATASDTYMLLFNDGYMRVLQNGGVILSGGLPYELPVPFAEADLPKLRTAQAVNRIFIAWGKRPKMLTRTNDITWALVDYPYTSGPCLPQNTNKLLTLQASAATGTITITASQNLFVTGHIGSVWRLDEVDFSAVPVWKALDTVAINSFRRNKGRIYQALNAADSGPNAPVHDDGDYSSGQNNVTWRHIGKSYGYVRITGITSAMVCTAEVVTTLPTDVVTRPTWRWQEAAWSDVQGWPTTVCLNDQGLVWSKGDSHYLSQTTDIYAFDPGDEDDPAQSFIINSPDGKLVETQWTYSGGVLMVGARSNEWVIRAESLFAKLSSNNTRAVPQTSIGSIPQSPEAVETGVVFISRSGRDIALARFDSQAEQVQIEVATIFSRNMLRGGARQLAYQGDPNKVLWVNLRNDQTVAVTFQPNQEVVAWHRHPMTNGSVEQIGAVQSSDQNTTEIWFCVRRVIEGVTRRYVELLQPYFEAINEAAPTAEGAWFMDCALRYIGAPATVLSGLEHLEGQVVRVVADGNDFGKFTVKSGKVTCPRAVRDAVVGLPIIGRIVDLPLDFSTQTGPTKGTMKTMSPAYVHRYESFGGALVYGNGTARPLDGVGNEGFSTPIKLKSDIIKVNVDASAQRELKPEILIDNGLPFTLLGRSFDLDARET
jgi:hypothetical protein